MLSNKNGIYPKIKGLYVQRETQAAAPQPCEPSQLKSLVCWGGRAGPAPCSGCDKPWGSALLSAQQGPGWSCTSAAMAVAVAVAAPCLGAARSRCQPRCPSTTGTWRKSCWMPSTSRAGAAPGRAPTVTGEQGALLGTGRALPRSPRGPEDVRMSQRQRQRCCTSVLTCLYEHTFNWGCV